MNVINEINIALKKYNEGKKNYAYKKIIKIFLKNKNNLKLRYNVAVIEQDLGLFKKAEENYKFLINNNFDIRSKINLYNLYIKQNQFNEALVLIEEVIKENHQILITYQDKANVLYGLKNYDESINECKSIINLDPQNIKVLNLLGLCYLKKENFDLANNTFLNALNIDQNNIITLNYLGRLNHEIRNSKEAEKYFLKAIKLNPNIFETLNNIAGFYLEEAEYDKALYFFKKADIRFPIPHTSSIAVNFKASFISNQDFNMHTPPYSLFFFAKLFAIFESVFVELTPILTGIPTHCFILRRI